MMDRKNVDLSSLDLHILAMGFMFCDHLWATVVPGNFWLTCVGRLAFPIFAFCIAEGYRHTGDLKKYQKRLLLFALLSELPFNLMYAGSWFYPFQQNVLWTFLLSLRAMKALDSIREKHRDWKAILLCALAVLGFYLLGMLLFVDYFGYGILTVLVFYFFRGHSWRSRLGQLICLYAINWQLMGGQQLPIALLGQHFEVPLQGFALLALIPIWCYRGRQGPHSKWIRLGCYGFYPAHLLILGLLSRL